VISIASVDFGQTLYLGVEIGGSGSTPVWDGEMTPRKKLGAVPAAFEADKLDGVDYGSFLRSDVSDTMSATSASTILTITQSGAGDILNLMDGASEVLTVLDGGNVGIGTTGPDRRLDVLDASNPQLRLTYTDGSVYTDFQTTSGGDLTITPSGGDVSIVGAFGILEGGTTPTYYSIFQGGDQSGNITYTLPAGQAGGSGYVLSNNGSGVLSWAAPGAASIAIGSSITSATEGSILFAGASGVLAQDNANFFWNDTGNALGLGTTGPDRRLDVLDATNPQLRLTYTDGSVYTDFQTTSGGDLTITPSGGNVSIVGNLLPSANETYTLGSTSNRWNDLYLGGETIHLGTSTTDEGTISYTSGNILSFDTDATTNGDIAFFTDDLYLDKSAGRVGIGTTSPSVELHVLGDGHVQGAYAESQGFEGVTFPPTSWTTGGSANWSRTTGDYQEGAASAVGGDVSDGQETWLDRDYTFSSSTGQIRFYWKVSSETNYDYLLFCVDNDTCTLLSGYKERISGSSSWVEVVYNVGSAGSHSFRWKYAKDIIDSAGSDTGWVDNIRFIDAGGDFSVDRTLTVGGDISGGGSVEIAGDAIVEGFSALGNGGTLSPDATLTVQGNNLYQLALRNHVSGQGGYWHIAQTLPAWTIGQTGLAFIPDSVNSTAASVMFLNTGQVGIGDYSPDHRLDVAGNIGLSASGYINFGDTDGTSGYGFYDNGGTIQYKNSGGSWANLGSGSGGMAIGASITSATEGSILFAGASGVLAQDNANFFWNDTGNALGLGTTGPDRRLDVLDATNPQLRLTYTDGSVYTDFQTTSGGDLTITPSGGNVSIVGNLLPSANETYTLGSTSNRWNDLYLGGETIHLGTSTTDEGTISYTSGNILSFDTDATTNGDIAFFTDDLYLDKSAGRVGIGTVTPSQLFTVHNGNIQIENNAGNHGPEIMLSHNGGDGGHTYNILSGGSGNVIGAGNFGIYDATQSAVRFMINGNGAVGIGTTGPDRRLDVLDATNPQLRLTYTDGSVYTDFQTTSGGDLTITPSGGDVSIVGNLLPSANETYTLGSTSNRWNDLYLGGETIHLGTSTTDEGTISYTSGNILSFDTDATTNGDIAFFTDDLYLDKSAGWIGLGDITPDHLLDVAGNIGLNASSYINFGDTDGTSGYGFRDNSGTLQYKNSGGSWINFGASSSSVTPKDFWSFNHFHTSGTTSMDPFLGVAVSSGTANAPTAAAMANGYHPGALLLRGSGTANGGYRIVGTNTTMVIGGGYVFEGVANIRTAGSGTTTIYLGFHDATTSTAPTDSVAFEISGTTVTGRMRGGSGGTVATGTTYTVSTGDTDWYRFKIVVNGDATRADFYIYNDSGTQVWTDYVSTGLPTTTSDLLTAGIVATNSGIGSVDLVNIDYMGMGTLAGYDAFITGGSGLWTVNGSSIYYNAGNVGIGTTSPSQMLSVSGTLGIIETGTSPQYYSIFQGGDQSANITYTLPTTVGSAGQQLTDAAGNGVLSWAAAGSLRELKNIDGVVEDPQEALETLLATNIYRFHYKEGMGTGDFDTQYVGVMADEASWAMHYNGNVVNPVNTLGYMVLGIQATNKRIDDLLMGITSLSGVGEENASVIEMATMYAPITRMLAEDPMNGTRLASLLSSYIQKGTMDEIFWTIDLGTGRIVPVGNLDMNGGSIYNIAEIIGIDDSWHVNTEGFLTVNGLVVKGDMEVGSREKPSGITLYDEVTGEPYCLKMSAGVMQALQGTCESLRMNDRISSVEGETVIHDNSELGGVILPDDTDTDSENVAPTDVLPREEGYREGVESGISPVPEATTDGSPQYMNGANSDNGTNVLEITSISESIFDTSHISSLEVTIPVE